MTSTRRYGLGAEGHGRHGLGATHAVHLVDAGDGRGRQGLGGDGAIGPRRHAQDQLVTPATRAGAAHMSTVEG